MFWRLRVHALLAAALAAAAASGTAVAGYGSQTASDNCAAAIDRQAQHGQTPGGGEKADSVGPANCDHAWNP